jgi:hypothetical protein
VLEFGVQGANLLVEMADEGELVLQRELIDRIGFAGGELFDPRFAIMARGPGEGGPVVGQLMGQSAAANRRPAGQSDGSGNLFATVAADRAFPAAVALPWR